MSYVGDDIPTLFDQDPAREAMRGMAHRGGAELRRRVIQNTPIDTGRLRESWYQEPVRHHRGAPDTYESVVATDVDYAIHVEHGTGLWGPEHKKYLITPKKPGGMLSWIGHDGQRVFARYVWHPGSPGQYMMAYGLGKTEATMLPMIAPEVEHWRVEQTKRFAVAKARRH